VETEEMNERDWGRLIRETKIEIQRDAEDKNKVVHHRIDDAVVAIEKSRDVMVGVAKDMAAIRAEMKAELSHRPDNGKVGHFISSAVNQHEVQFHDMTGTHRHDKSAPEQPATTAADAEEKVIRWAVAKIVAYIGAGGVSMVGLQKLAEMIFGV
jgi:hypothetical protein